MWEGTGSRGKGASLLPDVARLTMKNPATHGLGFPPRRRRKVQMGSSADIPGHKGRRLDSWKAIAEYLGRDPRSVQRWERERGMPIHRVPGEKGGAVFADSEELDAWLRSGRNSGGIAGEAIAEAGEEGGAELPEGQRRNGRKTGGDAAGDSQARIGERPARLVFPRMLFVALLILGLIAAAGILRFRGKEIAAKPSQAPPHRAMLAVLPFLNFGGDASQEYFADGLTEEMITDLGRLNPRALGVIARTSAMKYKHTNEDVRQIGSELGADYVLEGSVRRAGTQARISAQLIRVSDQSHLWAQNYDVQVKDVLDVQRDVAAKISAQIRMNLGNGLEQAGRRAANPEAYDDYLQGLFIFNRRDADLNQAVKYFRRAIARDPGYAPAYAALAENLTLVGLESADLRRKNAPEALAAAKTAIALDPGSAEAHTALGGIKIFYGYDWAGAGAEFRRALELNPNYAHAHHWYGNLYLGPLGRNQEAIAEMHEAQKLDPTNRIVVADLGQAYFFARRYPEALAIYKQVRDMDPEFPPAMWYLEDCYHEMGMYEQEVQEDAAWADRVMRTFDSGYGESHRRSQALLEAYRTQGYAGYVGEKLVQLQELAKYGNIDLQTAAVVYIEMGEKAHALAALEKDYREGSPNIIYLKVYPLYDPLRSEPRFQSLEQRVGLLRR